MMTKRINKAITLLSYIAFYRIIFCISLISFTKINEYKRMDAIYSSHPFNSPSSQINPLSIYTPNKTHISEILSEISSFDTSYVYIEYDEDDFDEPPRLGIIANIVLEDNGCYTIYLYY